MTALVLFVGPTRRYTVTLVVTFDPPRYRAPSNLRPVSLGADATGVFAAAIAALPRRDS